MHEELEQRLRGIARRAGFAQAPPGVVAAVLVLLGVAVVAALWRWWPHADGVAQAVSGSTPVGAVSRVRQGGAPRAPAASAPATRDAGVFVHVVGEVRRPGVYELPSGSRAEAAVDAAGGATRDADLAAVNLAAKLEDGTQVAVPGKSEGAAGVAGSSSAAFAPAAKPSGVAGRAQGAASAPVNINTADATLLDSLPGVGPSTADKIVAERQSGGPFASAEDLGRVQGIGPKKLAQLKPLITVR